MNPSTKNKFELYGEAYRIFQEIDKDEADLSKEEIQDKWKRIAEIELQLKTNDPQTGSAD
ncbi:MAG TPA: hypothetical protein VE954_05765 [Oligoflexus sp.]|uniref:hypothetical protein n=1 Tax=Oligoflexus sp. TaxID=1971216 RepID=UPI002D6D542B|nr:hypothetical protein [Oligoflexus sp.]HYX32599.1 hypothetical protein [Oligoflexus sp.]